MDQLVVDATKMAWYLRDGLCGLVTKFLWQSSDFSTKWLTNEGVGGIRRVLGLPVTCSCCSAVLTIWLCPWVHPAGRRVGCLVRRRQFGRHHGLPHIPLRVQQYDIQLRREETHQRHGTTQAYGKAHGGQSDLYVICSTKIDGDKCQPDYAGGIHSESYVLGFVERFGDFPSQYGVDGTDDDKQYGVCKAYHVLRPHGRDAHQLVVPSGRVVRPGSGWTHYYPDGPDQDLDSH